MPISMPLKAGETLDELIRTSIHSVRIEILSVNADEAKLTVTLQAREEDSFFADEIPSTETYEAFCRKVRDRKAYPPAKVPIPGGGRKSFTAEGQTKKPGSHSHDRHK